MKRLMTEARIIIPLAVPPDAVRVAELAMERLFGGFTRYNATGSYLADNGDTVRELVTVYDIAIPIGRRVDVVLARDNLQDIARDLLATGQECIYIRLPNGAVELFDGTDSPDPVA